MCFAKKKGTWRRSTRSLLAILVLMVATAAGHSSPRGESLEGERKASTSWASNSDVQEALSSAAELSLLRADGEQGIGGTWIPLTGIERANRSIFW